MMVGGQIWFGVTLGTLVMIITYTQQITSQLWDINNIFRHVNRAFGDAYDMTLILDESSHVVDDENAQKLSIDGGAVRFDNISFTHADGSEKVFSNLSLQIAPGQRIGLVGRSGSGKTTLTKLLLRFADVQAGSITIDGQNISEVKQKSLRDNIAYVPQETTLFHRSIAENISYGRPSASKAEIVKAAKLANAWEFIKNLPDGMDTLTGERGVKLSGGQRQRVAIARAILKDAPILVLDEATASLDTESEKLIQQALSRLMKNRTSIVIAHRLSTVAELDRIIVLDHGKIIEDGKHANLIASGGAYAKLWNRQTGGVLE
jgi:ATP-binding cassette subfamily B protein